ncbi:hypothetical protein AC1031_000500 [Aphanomyces cochlioides]|nr:hypothetical protein AC1031_000500 [Aphanomyces cochlioides]
MHRLLSCCCRRQKEVPFVQAPVERDYELLDVVGEGKTCRVVRAKSRAEPEKIVAVKMVQVAYLSTQSRVDALNAELRVLSMLHDEPQVLWLVDVYKDEAKIAIVTELVGGGEVVPALTSGRASVNEHRIRTLVRELVQVVAAMHSRGITHRDLKPENLLLDRIGDHLKLIDFGVAHIAADGESMVGLCGTGPFMAPEVFDKDTPYTNKVDIWALGVCTFVLLTGHVPFEGKFMSQLEDKIREGEYMVPSHQQLSTTARSFLATCLNIDAAQRPSAKALLRHPWLDLNQTQNVFSIPFGEEHMRCLQAYATKAPCSHHAMELEVS